ncbi:hypothetical protein Bbelb_400680 [Branchiostoma belcheri]|nr:hypothetical protein Bbelb_400680 [Branchiostoma belcheri]
MSPLWLLFCCCLALVFPGPGLAAEGQCTSYKRGGLLHMKHYVCCDNCGENNGAPDCGQTTYLADSTERDYCGSCGEDLGDARETVGMFGCGGCTGQAQVKAGCGEDRGDARETVGTFGCGGCQGQANVRAGCDKRYVYAGASFCWLHSKCFELRCQKVAQNAALESSPTDEPYCGDSRCDKHLEDASSCPPTDQPYCGDSHCDKHLEDASSCPFDCCPLRNPDECRHPHHCSKCPPLCCAEPGCCLD